MSVDRGGDVLLASDAVHYYDELDTERPFAVLADLADVYRAYDTVRALAGDGRDARPRPRPARDGALPGDATAARSRYELPELDDLEEPDDDPTTLSLETLADGSVDGVLPMYVDGGWSTAEDGGDLRLLRAGQRRGRGRRSPRPGRRTSTAPSPPRARRWTTARGAARAPPDRARLLWRMAEIVDANRELLARVESRDNGKALRETRAELDMIVRYFEFFSGVCQNVLGHTMPDAGPAFTYTRREPVGVVGAIIPWNSPLNMLAWKVCPALAGGNTVVLKPADETPVSALAFAALIEELELPAGVLNILPGIGARAGEAIVDHPDVDKLAFTGSTATGKRIAARAASTLKLATFELGGKSPNIVFADADLELAVQRTAYGIFSAGGQSCMAASRTLVHRDVREEFVGRLAEKAAAIRVGDPLGDDTQVGAQTSQRQLDKIEEYVGIGSAEGAQIMAGGRRPDGLDRGWFYSPTVLGVATTTCAWRARRSSARSRSRSSSPTRTRRSSSPTTRPTASPARSGRATSSARTASPTGCGRGRCGSTTTGCGTG